MHCLGNNDRKKSVVFFTKYSYLRPTECEDKKSTVLYLKLFFHTISSIAANPTYQEPYNYLPNSSNSLYNLVRVWAFKVSTEEKPPSMHCSDWTADHGTIPIKASYKHTKDSVWLGINHALQRYKSSWNPSQRLKRLNPSQRADFSVQNPQQLCKYAHSPGELSLHGQDREERLCLFLLGIDLN